MLDLHPKPYFFIVQMNEISIIINNGEKYPMNQHFVEDSQTVIQTKYQQIGVRPLVSLTRRVFKAWYLRQDELKPKISPELPALGCQSVFWSHSQMLLKEVFLTIFHHVLMRTSCAQDKKFTFDDFYVFLILMIFM